MDAELNALIDEVSELYHPEQHQVCNSSDEGEEVRKLWPKLRENVPVKASAPAWPRLRFRIPKQAPDSSSERAYDFDQWVDSESDCVGPPSVTIPGIRVPLESHGVGCRVQAPQSIPPEEAQNPRAAALSQRSPSPPPRQAQDASKTRRLMPDLCLASTTQLAPLRRLSAPAAPKQQSNINAATSAALRPPSPTFPTREHNENESVAYHGAIREFLARGAGRAAAAPHATPAPAPRRYLGDLTNARWPTSAPPLATEPDVRGLPPAGTRAAAARVRIRRPRPQDYPVGALAVPPLQLPPPVFKRGWVARKHIATVVELRRMRHAARHAEPDDADDEDDSDEGW